MKVLVISIFLLLFNFSFGQTPDDEWVFGYNSRLSFSTGYPVDAGWGPSYTEEGSSSICDDNGQLLFSVQGTNVFDKNGSPMQGGTLLRGSTSSTQNSLIVPFPGDEDNRYYHVFTVSAQNDHWVSVKHTGLEHTVVDMHANGGLGEVTFAPIELVPFVGEKIHATWHANQRDVWVVTHLMDDNAYYAIPITCEGLGNPVISRTGMFHSTSVESMSAQGALKISPDGSTIACTHTPVVPVTYERPTTYLEVGSFNNLSGQVIIKDTISKSYPGWQGALGYGIEFSPNSTKLYWSIEIAVSKIFQFDLQSANLAASQYLIASEQPSVASLQLGPDGKIYVARLAGSTQLHVIENPNASGSSVVYNTSGPSVSGYVTHGLPSNWMYPYPEANPQIKHELLSLCEGHLHYLSADSLGTKLAWSDGSNHDSLMISKPGNYWVTQASCPFDTTHFHVSRAEYCHCDVYLPNAFTANGDGVNDLFRAISDCELLDFNFQIYNRWGELVFETSDIDVGWDGYVRGKPSKTDVFVWRVSWRAYDDGTLKDQTKVGHVTVL